MDPHIIDAIKYHAIQCTPKGHLIKNAMTCVGTDFVYCYLKIKFNLIIKLQRLCRRGRIAYKYWAIPCDLQCPPPHS